MNRGKPAWRILLLLTLLLLGGKGQTFAQEVEHYAGLVLQFADGSTKTYCVAFPEESISGLDLLLKTGLDVRVESFGAAGAMICKIGPDGCDFPEEACVCESYGPGGVYWSYHHLKDGSWNTSGVGISSYRLRDGDVDGLAWSSGKPPPLFTFSQICGNVGAQPPTQAEPTATRRPPPPVPTKTLPTITSEPLAPEPTREPTLPQVPTIRPSSTSQPPARGTVTAPVRATNTVQQNIVASTSTATTAPTNGPMPAPTNTGNSQPTAPVPTATDTAVPTRVAGTATPVLAVIDARNDTGETTARNIGLGIGVATLAGLVGWGIWSGRRRRGRDVG